MSVLKLPDGKELNVKEDQSYSEVIAEHLPFLTKKALAVKVNGNELDLSATVGEGGNFEVLTFDTEAGKEVFWHSSAHVLAQAIKRVFPKAQLTVGPVVKNGPGFFYYDILFDEKISEEDFPRIEEEIHKVVAEKLPVTREVYDRDVAIAEFKGMGEDFKAEIIGEIPQGEHISVYKQGEFQDLCRGPHVPSTGSLGYFKLTAISGAYWKGDPNNPQLQRIYGISFPDKKMLKEHQELLEEAKRRDHRKIGKELDLFSFHDEGPGFPFYHNKGTTLFNNLTNYIRYECAVRGYEEIRTPIMLSDELWTRSGHMDYFKENMYFSEVDERGFAVKPMNCPGSNLVYKTKLRSYRDLPLRQAELGLVHRHELSGVLHGLFRVRSFTQDDAHVYCTPEQVKEEIGNAIQFTLDVYRKFGFTEVKIFLSTRPGKAIGSDAIWEKATQDLIDTMKDKGLEYGIKEGEGAFYGPKIEFNVQDSLKRNWQLGTIQVDFFLPERFELEYIGEDGKKHRPVMLHRAILGSLERFLGIIIEHFEGRFPLWLAPVQVRLMTVTPAQADYARDLQKKLLRAGLRAELDESNEKIGYKIREWTSQKINYAAVIGAKEAEENLVTVRKFGEQDSKPMSIDNFIEMLLSEVEGE